MVLTLKWRRHVQQDVTENASSVPAIAECPGATIGRTKQRRASRANRSRGQGASGGPSGRQELAGICGTWLTVCNSTICRYRPSRAKSSAGLPVSTILPLSSTTIRST